jgi:hypothetical protein
MAIILLPRDLVYDWERFYDSRDGGGLTNIRIATSLRDLHDGGPKGDSGKIEFLKLSRATQVVFLHEFSMYHIHSFSAYPQRKSLNATVWNVFLNIQPPQAGYVLLIQPHSHEERCGNRAGDIVWEDLINC